jgi:hypothetical protein
MLPAFCLARQAVETRDVFLGSLVAAAVIMGLLGVRGLVGRDLATLALWYGNVMGSALMLLAGCTYVPVANFQPKTATIRLRYPLMTPMGRMRATFRDRPARSTTSTTSSTSL